MEKLWLVPPFTAVLAMITIIIFFAMSAAYDRYWGKQIIRLLGITDRRCGLLYCLFLFQLCNSGTYAPLSPRLLQADWTGPL